MSSCATTIFNARNFFASDVPSYKKNDFGYTIGGPVWIPQLYNTSKEKTFFFWSEEWRKERLPNTFNVQVPSNPERQGIFNDVCPAAGSAVNKTGFPDCPVNPLTGNYYPNNTVPIDPNAQAIMALVPAPTAGSGANSFFNASPPTPTNWREELVRIDQNFNDSNRFFFRFIHDSWNTITPTSLWSGDSFPTVGTNFVGPGVSLVAHMTTNISPTLLNEFTFSYTTDHIFLTPSGTWQRPSSMTMTGLFEQRLRRQTSRYQHQQRGPVWRRLHSRCRRLALEQRQPNLYIPRSDCEDLGFAQHLRRVLFRRRTEERTERRGNAGLPEFQ